MDPKTKSLLPNLLYLKTLMEREILFREVLAEFLCGLYMMETRLPGGNGPRGRSEEPCSPAELNVSNPAETAGDPTTSPGDKKNSNSAKSRDFDFNNLVSINESDEVICEFIEDFVAAYPGYSMIFFLIFKQEK